MGNVASSLVPTDVPPAQQVQTFFVLSSLFIFSIQFLPHDIRGILMDYGARRPASKSTPPSSDSKAAPSPAATELKALLAKIADYTQVPHSWFRSFYITSVGWSIFWLLQFLRKGKVMAALAAWQDKATQGKGMGLGQTYVVAALMAAQGMRRLYESYFVARMGKSPMWIVHWGLAIAYYTAMGLSVWIEGSGAILEAWKTGNFKPKIPGYLPLLVALFGLASAKQNECHAHLAGLRKYTLPKEGLFKYFVCPHYTCECLLYLALAFAAAPQGSTVNKTVLSGLLFVIVNLGSTAYGTKQWYVEKFGAEQVGKRWMMIPYLW